MLYSYIYLGSLVAVDCKIDLVGQVGLDSS